MSIIILPCTYEAFLMTIKKTARPRTKAAAKAPATNAEAVQECPAFPKCRELKVSCETCLALSPDAWREHVRGVLAR
ncbi:MAG: hypothetical protein WCW68_01660 [Methanothrix sp.]